MSDDAVAVADTLRRDRRERLDWLVCEAIGVSREVAKEQAAPDDAVRRINGLIDQALVDLFPEGA